MTWRNILEVYESRRAAARLPALAAMLCPFLSARADLIVPVDAGGRIPAAPGTTTGQAVFTFTVIGADPFLPAVDVNLDVVHTWTEDLEIMLTSPTGASVQLFYHRGGVPEFHDFDDTLFDDDAARYLYEGAPPWAGSFKPEEEPDPPQQSLGLSKFIGINPNGVWTLTIDDIYAGDYGYLYRYDDGPFETRRDVLSGTYLRIGAAEAVIPAVSEWGVIIMTLLCLTAGTVVLERRWLRATRRAR